MREIKKDLTEKGYWKKIYTAFEVDVFDSAHFLERTKERFPNLSWINIMQVIEQGLTKIFHYPPGHFVIISKSTGMRIALDYRQDRHTDKMIAVIPTVLSPDMTFKKFNDKEIFVEGIERTAIFID